MTVLVVGGSGYLGAELARQGGAAGRDTAATFHTRPRDTPGVAWHRLDLRDPRDLERVLDATDPTAVINASSGDADWAVTAEGGMRLARAAARRGVRLVHVSTDAVFSGRRDTYDETCLPDPLTPYGAAKATAETAVRLLCADAVVARTSLILGDGRSGHERLVRGLATGTRRGVLFTDDVRCPVHVRDLAAALWELTRSDRTGVFHLAGPHAVSRHELGTLIARRDGLDASRLTAGRRADTPLPGALRLVLDGGASRDALATRLRGAREFLTS
ncbi:sugar nucleotide-binding protein [Streptomyces sp. NPDC047141]|uniref:SDR family oxidoreductase n=1 Tax=unclassified Streptomyces TaxID=2593676 RepID=UPI00340D79EE